MRSQNIRRIRGDQQARTYQQIFDAARAAGELDIDVDVSRANERLLGPLLFRRMLGDEDFGRDYVIEGVDDFLTPHQAGR